VTEPVPAVAPPPAGSFGRGLAAAFAAAIVGAIVWAIITVTSDYRIGVVAVGIGFLVGLAIERFGGGDRRLPIAGAVIALLGCLLGDLFAEAHIIARDLHLGIFDVFQHPHALWDVYTHTFRIFDAVFYAIAAYEGFRFGQRGVQRATAAAAANQPPSIEVPGTYGGAGLGVGLDPSAPLGSAAETAPAPVAPQAGDPPVAQ
jgi:hypothetical protein